VRRLLLALALVAGALAPATSASAATDPASSAPAAGSIGIRLVDAPTSAKNDPRAQSYIVDYLAPGAVIHRRIEVSNTTAGSVHVALYPAAATIKEGSFVGDAGHAVSALTTWTAVDPVETDVAAGAKAMSTVTINVPPDAAPGEQYGVIWAETSSAVPAGGGVTQVSRVGIRLYVDVGPGNPLAADFAVDTLTAQRAADGSPTVVASVHNTGGRAVDMSGTLGLSAGPGGLSAGPFPAQLGTTLAPGQTEPVTVKLDKLLPAGPWDAKITLHSGLVERSAQATITFPDHGAAAPVKAKAAGLPTWLLPAVIGLGLLLLIALLLLLLRRRRHRPAVALPPPSPQSPSSGGPTQPAGPPGSPRGRPASP
jgi:hypothetical protein